MHEALIGPLAGEQQQRDFSVIHFRGHLMARCVSATVNRI